MFDFSYMTIKIILAFLFIFSYILFLIKGRLIILIFSLIFSFLLFILIPFFEGKNLIINKADNYNKEIVIDKTSSNSQDINVVNYGTSNITVNYNNYNTTSFIKKENLPIEDKSKIESDKNIEYLCPDIYIYNPENNRCEIKP